jgi:phosphoribosylformimino-5-aminoimidazole carboxamide ribotide isomerase
MLEPDCAVLEGAITGRALYDGRLDPLEALALIATRSRDPLSARGAPRA